jgi:hypothetical protein
VTVYVLSGAFTLELDDRAPVTIRASEVFVEPAHVRMTGRNLSAEEPTTMAIFFVADPRRRSPIRHECGRAGSRKHDQMRRADNAAAVASPDTRCQVTSARHVPVEWSRIYLRARRNRHPTHGGSS